MSDTARKRHRLWFIQDIITKAELRHQWYVLEKSRSGTGWIVVAVLMLLPAVLFSFYGIAMSLFGLPLTWNPIGSEFSDILISVGFIALITMNISLYLIVILITLGLSSNSITRERKGKTWDVLLLTNVNAKQVVWGKWWASLVALWGDHAMIAFLRVGFVCIMMSVQEPFMAVKFRPLPLDISPVLAHSIVLSLIMIAYTMIDAMFTAALGVGGAVSAQNASVVGGITFAVRVVSIGIFVFWILQIWGNFRGGWAYLPSAFGGLLFFALLTFIALKIGEGVAVRGEVSPPQR